MLIKQAQREFSGIAGFAGPGKGRLPVSGIVILAEGVRIVLKPLVGVNLVKGYAWLEEIHEGVSLVCDGLLEQFFGLLLIPDKGTGDKGCIECDGDGQRIEGFQDDAADLDGGFEAA